MNTVSTLLPKATGHSLCELALKTGPSHHGDQQTRKGLAQVAPGQNQCVALGISVRE